MKRERRPIFLEPGPKRDALLSALATVADRVAARKEARLREEARLLEQAPEPRTPADDRGGL